MAIDFDNLYAGGEWIPASGERLTVLNPATEEPVGSVVRASIADLDVAVAAARKGFDAWLESTLDERLTILERLADGLDARAREIGALVTAEMGAPVKLAGRVNVGLPVAFLRAQRELAASIRFTDEVGNSRIVRRPAGVVACITPWNYPIHQIVAKVAPALVAGCTVVVKPSDDAPLSPFLLAEVAHEVGLPPGVFNLVVGGADVGAALVSHPDVDMVSFTGSTTTGRRIAAAAAELIRPVTLELGGKSANVVLDDADLETAVKVGVANAFMNAGQTCNACTRLLVPEALKEQAYAVVAKFAPAYTVGDPTDGATRMGPLVSAAQRDRVVGYIEGAISDGARLLAGGPERPEGLESGYYVKPTVFGDVDPDSTLAQEEVFGPVLAVIPYSSETEAIEIANNSRYGLGGGVWSRDVDHASAVAERMETGQVDINGGVFNVLAPFGGFKNSGIGREFGAAGIEEYLRTKSYQF